jgi:hypothetical protein
MTRSSATSCIYSHALTCALDIAIDWRQRFPWRDTPHKLRADRFLLRFERVLGLISLYLYAIPTNGYPQCTVRTVARTPSCGSKFGGKSFVQDGKRFELIAIAGHEAASSVLDPHEASKAVPLDLEDPIRMAERSGTATEGYCLERWKH